MSDEEESMDAVIALHAAKHAELGTTIHVRLDPEVPFAQVEALMDAFSSIVYGLGLDGFVSAGRPE